MARASVSPPLSEPSKVLPPGAEGEHGALSHVVVDTDAAIFEEQLEGGQRLAL